MISASITGSRRTRLATCGALLALVPGCSGDADGPATRPRGDEVVVASFNFPESALVAEMYAGALEAAGVPVRLERDLGPREMVQPALLQGLVDLVPEYLGTALTSLGGEPAGEPAAVRRKLDEAAVQWQLRVLEPSPAQNQNGLAVTRDTAERLGLRTTSDLAGAASRLTLAGPPECPTRPYCLVGFERVYGLGFGRFLPYDTERQRVTALREGVADVAVMFTTDGELATGDLALLEDDRHLQPPEHIVPIVSAAAVDRYGERLTAALGAVSSRLTSQHLVFLNWRTAVAGKDVRGEARGWLARHRVAGAPR